MKIKITKRMDAKPKYRFYANPVDLPGSPPIGYGRTEKEAVGEMFMRLFIEHDAWIEYIDLKEPIEIERSNYNCTRTMRESWDRRD